MMFRSLFLLLMISSSPTWTEEYEELERQIAESPTWDNERLRQEVYRWESLIHESDRTPVDVIWRRTHALLNHLQDMEDPPDLAFQERALASLRKDVHSCRRKTEGDPSSSRALFERIASIRRSIALANPLLDFDKILFLKRHRALFEHMCDQYYGIAARPGGGLYLLENAFGETPLVHDLLAEAVVERGRLRGQPLRATESHRDMSYDGLGRLKGAPGLSGETFLKHGHTEAFRSLRRFAWGKFGGNGYGLERNKTSYSIPGDVGAEASILFRMLEEGHHGVELTREEMRRITLWLDSNSVFYGDYFDTEAQAKGQRRLPRLQ